MARPSSNYQPILRSVLDSQKLVRVPEVAELLFYKLLVASDGYGRFHGGAFQVACRVYPERVERNAVSSKDIGERLDALEDAGLIQRYAIEEKVYLEIVNYFEPANKGRVGERFPGPPGGDSPVPDSENPCPQSGDDLVPVVGTTRPQHVPDDGDHTETETETETNTETKWCSRDGNSEPPSEQEQPGNKRKPPINGKAELRAALDRYDSGGEPLGSKIHEMAEAYRAVRASRRWPVWDRDRWRMNLEVGRFDGELQQGCLEESFTNALKAPHQALYAVKSPGSQKAPEDEMAKLQANLAAGAQLARARRAT